jgi:hypothetical protein
MEKATAPVAQQQTDWRIWAGGIIALFGLWLGISFKRRRTKSKALALREQTAARRIVIAPASHEPPFVRIEIEGVTQIQPHSPEISGPVREGLILQLSHWLKTKFMQRLVSERAELLKTHQTAALKVLAMDERLSKVERQIQERNREYEQRIDALLKELEVAREENRELIRAKIALLKAEMEKNSKLQSPSSRD